MVSEADVVSRVMQALAAGIGGRIETVNLNHLRLCRRRPDFAAYCQSATLLVADGMPIIWAASLQGTPLPARVTGSDLVWSLSRAAAREGRSIFLAGGDADTARLAADRLRCEIADLRVAGTDPLPRRADGPSLDSFHDAVERTRPHVVFVGLSTIGTWRTLVACMPVLPDAWWIGVGSGLGFAAGAMRRAPRWAQRAGLEWLHRLVQEPMRLAPRYLIFGLPTAAWLFASAIRRRLRGLAVE